MGNLKSNDCNKAEPITYDRAYRIQIYKYSEKATLEGDSDFPSIKSIVQNMKANGCQWKVVTWSEQPNGKKKKEEQAVLSMKEE